MTLVQQKGKRRESKSGDKASTAFQNEKQKEAQSRGNVVNKKKSGSR